MPIQLAWVCESYSITSESTAQLMPLASFNPLKLGLTMPNLHYTAWGHFALSTLRISSAVPSSSTLHASPAA